MQTQGLLHTTYAGAANRIRSQRFNMYAYVWGKGRRSLCHCTQSPKTPLPRSKFWLTALEITGVGGCTPSAVRVAHGPRGPGRMRGPSRPAARWGRPGAYLVRPARRHRTTSSRAAARARPGKLRSCGSNGSSEKRPMPADTSSAVWFPRGRSGQPGVSLGAATLLLPAASLGGSPPVRAPEAGLLAALPGMSPRAPEAESQSSCTPLPRPGPAPTHAHRPAPRPPPARRLLENGARVPRGRKEGQEEGEGVRISWWRTSEGLEKGDFCSVLEVSRLGSSSPSPRPSGGGTQPAPWTALGLCPLLSGTADLLGTTLRTENQASGRYLWCALPPAWSGAASLALHILFAHTLLSRAYCVLSRAFCVRSLVRARPGMETGAVRHTVQEERRKTSLLQNNAKGRNRSGTSPTGGS